MKSRYDIDELLARYFADEPLDESQQRELETWKTSHQKEFKRLKQMLHPVPAIPDEVHFDASRAWNKIEGRLTERTPASKNRFRLWMAGSVAASLLLIMVWSIYRLYLPEKPTFEYANTNKTERIIMLPDSSEVTLSPNSRLTYLTAYDKDRIVNMEGKAFFSVKKNGSRFLVNTSNLHIEVLGTSFLVDAIAGDNMAGVYVATGKVKVSTENHNFILQAHEKAEMTNGQITIGTIDDLPNTFGTYHRQIRFEAAPLTDVIQQIYQLTGIRIDLDNKLKTNRITTQIDLFDIDNLITELSFLCHCRCDTLIPGKHYKLYEE